MLTEWLAEVLRASPDFQERFLRLLGAPATRVVAVRTQEHFAGVDVGFFDLSLFGPTGRLAVVEVKWESPLDEGQLERYERRLAEEGAQCVLASLTRGEKPEERFGLTWPQIWRALRDSGQTDQTDRCDASFLMRELEVFLEENGMVEHQLGKTGLASARGFPDLLRFTHATLEQAGRRLDAKLPKDAAGPSVFWPRDERRANDLFRQLLQRDRIVTWDTWGPFNVYFGVLLRPGEGSLAHVDDLAEPNRYRERFPWATSWVELEPSRWPMHAAAIARLRKFAQARKDHGWSEQNDPQRWRVVYRLRELADFAAVDDLAAWFHESVMELWDGARDAFE